jgi:uncharacterized protein DUF5996
MTSVRTTHVWPELPLSEWKDTYDTPHRWTQIIGKIRLALTPQVRLAHCLTSIQARISKVLVVNQK